MTLNNTSNPSKQQIDELASLYLEGDLREALRQGNALAGDFPRSHIILNFLGAINLNLGRDEEAIAIYNKAIEVNPDFAETYNNLGTAFNNLAKYDEAIANYNKAIELQHDYAEAHNNLGNALNDRARHNEAIASYNRAIEVKPDFPQAHNNLGTSLNSLARYDEAIASYNRAIEVKPDFPQAYNNLGTALTKLVKYEEAVASYNKAIEIKPDYAEAHNNLGNTFNELGKFKEAITIYNKAIEIKPDYAEAHNNLGNALNELGEFKGAITSYNKAIEFNPDFAEPYNNLGIILSSIQTKQFSKSLAKSYLDMLNFGTIVSPAIMVRSIIALLKHHETIKEAISCNKKNTLRDLASEFAIKLSKIPLCIKIMGICPIPDMEIESLLTELRRILLLERINLSANHNLFHFQNALALQCFTNEYIYEETEEEISAIKVLEASLRQSFLNNEELAPYDIACLASYRSLFDYPWATDIAPPVSLKLLFKRQVVEKNEEILIKKDIPRLNPIKDDISLAVQDQYEENPYPRWVNTKLEINSMTLEEVVGNVGLRVANQISPLPEAPQILIAGCGTGQHALGTASRFKNSHVLAIDLSLSSLGYAKRKTEEIGVTNIDYLQGDLLDLEMLDKQFDIIESVGVLHHMADPIAGWKVLTNCLKQNGLMRIGLYSELARQHIVQARGIIADTNIFPNKQGMLEFRRRIIKLNDPVFKTLQNSNDFYSTSTVRDLLFHVKEYRFTIPQIRKALDELGLAFMGFEFPNQTTPKAFKDAYPKQGAIYDLDKWYEYEILNPRLFLDMYQFWVQKL